MDLLWKERKRIWCGLPLTFTVYSYDNERFYVKSGFLNQRQDEVRLYRIQDLTVTRSLSQRIFGMGTILVNSSDKTLGDFEIKNIKNVMDVKEQLSALVEIQRDQKRYIPEKISPGIPKPIMMIICNQNLKFPVSIEKKIPGIFYLCACISCCIFFFNPDFYQIGNLLRFHSFILFITDRF